MRVPVDTFENGKVVESIIEMPDGTPEEIAGHERAIAAREQRHKDQVTLEGLAATPPKQADVPAAIQLLARKLLGA